MLIAITAVENSLQSAIDQRFGRAAFFLLVNTVTGEFTALDNSTGIKAANGAGTGAAQTLSEYGVEALYTGRVGPKAAAALGKARIPYYENITGTVQEVMKRIKNGPPGQQTHTAQDRSPARMSRNAPGSARGMGMGRGRRQSGNQGRGSCYSSSPAPGQPGTGPRREEISGRYRLVDK